VPCAPFAAIYLHDVFRCCHITGSGRDDELLGPPRLGYPRAARALDDVVGVGLVFWFASVADTTSPTTS